MTLSPAPTHARKPGMEDGANLVVRLPEPLRFAVKLAATEADRTIQQWVEDAIRERLERVKA